MSIRTIVGYEDGHGPDVVVAVLYDSVSGLPLPIKTFSATEESASDVAERFLADAERHFGHDLRHVPVGRLQDYQEAWLGTAARRHE